MHGQLAQHLRSPLPKRHPPIPRGNFGESRGGVGKSGVLEHKSGNISETRKDRGKLLWMAYRKSPMLFPTVPFPTPYGLLFPKIGVRNPHPKLQSLLSQERVKLYGLQIWPVHSQGPSEQKPIKNLGKSGRGRSQGLQKIFSAPRGHLCDSSSFLVVFSFWHEFRRCNGVLL